MSVQSRVANGVVVVLMSGTRKKGFVYDLSMERGDFHLYLTSDMSDAASEVIRIQDCKAVCFVKSLTGNPDYQENKTDLGARKGGFGRPFEVRFADGELLRGTVETFDPKKLGFYIVPPDPKSNNTRIYVVQANAVEVRLLPAFGADGDGSRWETPDPVRYPAEKRAEFVLRILRGKGIEKLSEECYLPAAILAHWRMSFLEGGVAGLLQEEPPPPEPPPAPGAPPRKKPLRFPPKRRVEAVLRVLLSEDAAVVSQVLLAPLHLMAEWQERFLESGRLRLLVQAAQEAGESPEILRARYEAVVRDYAPDRETAAALLARLVA
jgi:hypothetical protein